MSVRVVFRLTLTYADGRRVSDRLPAIDLADAIRLCALIFDSDPDIARLTLSDPTDVEHHALDR